MNNSQNKTKTTATPPNRSLSDQTVALELVRIAVSNGESIDAVSKKYFQCIDILKEKRASLREKNS